MKVDKELIEKYHLGLCSAEEIEAVENWLLYDDSEEELLLPEGEGKLHHKNEIWAGLSAQIPEIREQSKVVSLNDQLTPIFWRSIAAILFVGMAGTILWKLTSYVNTKTIAEVKQNSIHTRQIVKDEMNILLGKESKAEFNNPDHKGREGNINFCGTIRIDPKQDMELTIQGTCEIESGSEEKISLKKGQTYIAVNYQFNEENELIVVDQRNLINLPPMMQREIMKQFPI